MSVLPASIGIILNNDEDHVLLVKRRDVPIWVLPGGGIEENETPEEALIREIQEETGFLVQIIRKCGEYSPINRLTAFTSVFICTITSGEMISSNETSDIKFYPINQLPCSLFRLHGVWLDEGLSQLTLIQRSITEITYGQLCKYFICHPWQLLRFAWTRFTKP